MIKVSKAGAVALIIAFAGCSGPRQCSVAPHLGVSVERTQQAYLVKWEFRNETEDPIWVGIPDSYGYRAEWDGQVHLPGFVTPYGEVVFVLGNMTLYDRVIRDGIDPDDVGEGYTRVLPGKSLSGAIRILLPYTIQGEFVGRGLSLLGNPFEKNFGDPNASPERIEVCSGFYLCVEYWRALPGLLLRPDCPSATVAAYREAMGAAMIDNETLRTFRTWTTHRVVCSDLVNVKVPLAKPAILYRP
ncbi:MAG: hypothetical protein ACE15C_20940 [Phycisphaerae bacterium]